MEKQIIAGLMAIMIGLAGWNLKTTHDLSITVSNMQVSHADKDAIQDMKMAIQRLELLLLQDQWSRRKSLFNRIKAGNKGGKPGQWSARKAQMLAVPYKKAGGGYRD